MISPLIGSGAFRCPAAAAGIYVLASAAAAESIISVNFEGLDSNGLGPNRVAPDGIAGVEPAANWANAPGASGSIASLPDSSGASTSASITWAGQSTWSWEQSGDAVPANPNGAMFNGYLDTTGTGGSHSITLTDIPYAQYDVIVYVDGENAGASRPARFRAGDAGDYIYADDTANWTGTFAEATGTSLATATPGANYVRFRGLTGSAVTIAAEAASFRACVNGLQVVGTALDPRFPQAETDPATEVGTTGARLHGTLVTPGEGATATALFFWGRSDGGTSEAAWENMAAVGDFASPTEFSDVLSGLDPLTQYFYRARAENGIGSVWASESFSFTTLAAPPEVDNLPAQNVYSTSARLGASVVDAGGEAPAVTIYFGEADAGADAGAWSGSAALGEVPEGQSASAVVSGLIPDTEYFFRASAENSGGAVWAPSSATFLTPTVSAPSVVTGAAENVTGTSATLRGEVTDAGGDPPTVTIWFGIADGGTSPDAWDNFVQLPAVDGSFARTASGFLPLTDYFFRASATNAGGTSWSPASQAFRTRDGAGEAIVINELHIDEDDKTRPLEFIELYNNSDDAIDVSGWEFTDGVSYVIPAGTVIAARDYLVVAQDPGALSAEFGVAGALGPWSGKLRNSGETVTLRDAAGAVMDAVDYQLGFPWPTYGEPPSPSIELIHPGLENDVGGNWRSAGNTAAVSADPAEFVLRGSVWSYFKGTELPPTDGGGLAWQDAGYDDGGWLSGTAPIGYGDGDDATVLTDMQGGYRTVFLRREFTVEPGQVPPALSLRLHYDDAAVVWINGTEVLRTPNVPGGPIPFPLTDGYVGNHEANLGSPPTYEEFTLSSAASYLTEGPNVLAVQLINATLGSSDASIDAELVTPGAGGGYAPADPSPGRVNSVFASHAPPAIRKLERQPARPASGEPVTVTAVITDPEGVASAALEYQIVEPGDYITLSDPRYAAEWTAIAMNDNGENGDALARDSVFTAVIPGSVQGHRRLIRYRLQAADGAAAAVDVPYRDDPQPNFAYFVYDALPVWTARATPSSSEVTYGFDSFPPIQRQVPVYHLVTRRRDHVDAQFIPDSTRGSGYGGSDYLWQGALVFEGKVYDHIRYRARGGVWRYSMGKNMWKFDFNRGHRFEARDEYGRPYSADWDKLNLSALIQQGNFGQRGEQGIFEGAGFRLHNLAGNPAPKTHYVHFRIVESADESAATQYATDFQGLYMAIEQLDGQFLDEHDLPDGNLYKMEGGTGELNNQGATLPTNKSDLNAFMSAYTGGTPPQSFWEENLALEDYYSFYAIVTGIHDNDIHAGKNYFFFHRPPDPLDPLGDKWQVVNWDLDLTWTITYNRGGPNGPLDQDVFAHADLQRGYRNRMREIRDLLYNPDQTGMVIDEIVQFVHTPGEISYVDADRAMWDYNPILVSNYVRTDKAGHGRYYEATVRRTFAAMIQHVKNFISTRGSYIDSQVLTDDALVPHPPTLAFTGGAGFPANEISAASSAYSSPVLSPFAAMEYRIARISDPGSPSFNPFEPRKYEIEADWESGELASFTPEIKFQAASIRPGERYRARVRHRDAAGRWSHWSAPLEFTASEPDPSALRDSLMITEIMFNPPAPQGAELSVAGDNDEFEFIELMNVSESAVDLTDVRFTKGVDCDITPETSIAAGERVVVVKNPAAFAARYGSGIRIIGSFGSDNLSNGGERLKLSLGAGTAIHDFEYDDQPPWPAAADGTGYSLVLIRPGDRPDHANPANWRLSRFAGGSPGADDSLDIDAWSVIHGVTDLTADDERDGLSALIEFMLGLDPNLPDARGAVTAELRDEGAEGTFLVITIRRRIGTDGVEVTGEWSADLDEWTPGILLSSVPNGDGTLLESWRSAEPVTAGATSFARIRATAAP